MTEGRPLQRDEKAIAIVNIINSRNNRKRVDPSFPFLALSTLSQQVIKRWEERERDKEKECDNDNQLISLSKGPIVSSMRLVTASGESKGVIGYEALRG